jgi:hypothetical protein
MAHRQERDPRQRPTEGRRDLRNLNLDPQDLWDEPVSRADAVESAGLERMEGRVGEPGRGGARAGARPKGGRTH